MSETGQRAAEPDHKQQRHTQADAVAAASRKLMLILSDAGVLDKEDLLWQLGQHPNEFLGNTLIREGILVEDYLHGLLIRTLHLPWVAADGCSVHPDVCALLPESFCRNAGVMPLSRSRQFLTLAVANPLDPWVLETVQTLTDLKVRPVMCSATQLDTLIRTAYHGRKERGHDPSGEPAGEQAEAGKPSLSAYIEETTRGLEQASACIEEAARDLGQAVETDTDPQQPPDAASAPGEAPGKSQATAARAAENGR